MSAEIDTFTCHSDYWLMIVRHKEHWQFNLYFPEKYFFYTGNVNLSSRTNCLDAAREIVSEILQESF